MAIKGVISYWWLPILSSLVWLGMLLGLFLHWIIDTNSRQYPSMESGQTIAYISDIGAQKLQPLFIAGSCVVTVTLDLSFGAERWLRHKGRLVPNVSLGEKLLFFFSIVFAIVGTVGLICLSIFDTVNYPTLHDVFLVLFIGGYWFSAVFICWEYQRLGIKHRNHRILRISFWIKLAFILLELGLVIAFGVITFHGNPNAAAILEWVIAIVFTFYVFSFVIDLAPAVRTKSHHARFSKGMPRQMEEAATSEETYHRPAAF